MNSINNNELNINNNELNINNELLNNNILFNNIILNEIKKLSVIFIDNIKKVDSKIDDVLSRVKKLENKIEFIESHKTQNDSKKLKDIKYDILDISDEHILKALNYRDYRSVLYIFKLYYKNKLNLKYAYPIRIKSQHCYEYYSNEEWISDLYGRNIINILCKNIEKIFIKNNIIEKVELDMLLLNQDFIYKLSDDKFKRSLLIHIAEEVRQNNI